MSKYEALYLPGDDNPLWSKGGFNSEEEALEYIKTKLCPDCLKDLELGYIMFEEGKEEVLSPIDTFCGAEWRIVKEEEQ